MREQIQNGLAIILAGFIAFLYISAMPSALFVHIHWADIDPVCITLLINIILAMAAGISAVNRFLPNYAAYFSLKPFRPGFKQYGISCCIAFFIPCVAFGIGLFPFDYRPTAWKVLIEGVVYYIGVGIIEEFFCRGLLQNAIERLLHRKKDAQLLAVLISAFLFGLGHIFGMLGMPLLLAACKVIWAIGLGIYLGAVYVRTKNLWLVAFFHFFIDLCGLPFCFSTQKSYPTVSAVIILIAFLFLGIYGICLLTHKNGQSELA